MTNPEHLPNGLSREEAIAPYNFVELPEQVVRSQDEQEPVTHNQYHEGRHTGRIECVLTTASPLYVRCALTLEQFQQGEHERQNPPNNSRAAIKNTPDFFYTHDKEQPVIPGSSLRGMLRTLVEIASFGKIEQVTKTNLVYRAVGDTSSVGESYRFRMLSELSKKTYSFRMQAGYMRKINNKWQIIPAQNSKQDGTTFARIESRNNTIPPNLQDWHDIKNAKRIFVKTVPEKNYSHNKGRVTLSYAKVTDAVDHSKAGYQEGVLVKTGSAPRKHMEFVFNLPDMAKDPILVSDKLIKAYQEQITQGQQEIVGKMGALQDWQPIFYIIENNELAFFGHAMMFRLPYKKSPFDFIPELKDKQGKSVDIDLAEAIFGYVPPKKDDQEQVGAGRVYVRRKKDEQEQARAGRVFVSDATLNQEQENVWLREEPITPRILATPKPTTFQHYLVQTEDNKAKLKHYASKPDEETVIRGHKLYWHKGDVSVNDIEDKDFRKKTEEERKEDTQHTRFKPVKSGISFTFTIHFENLSKVELGALLWVLNLATQDQFRLKLGMGKPLGMGAVKIVPTLILSNREQRYRTLFNGGWWETGDAPASSDDMTAFVDQFRSYVQEHAGIAKLEESPRIQMLLAMLSWPGPEPVEEKTRYMEIERDTTKHEHVVGEGPNEYKERFVLPDPLDVRNTSRQSKQQNTTTKTTQSVPSTVSKPKPTKSNIPQVGDTVTGNRKGFQRGKKGPVVVKINQVPSNVQGIIPAEYAKGNASGGVKAEVIKQEKEGNTIILYLKPVKKEQGEK